MADILDRSGTYLNIFTSSFVIDKSLPKWSIISKAENENLTDEAKQEKEYSSGPIPMKTGRQGRGNTEISIRDFKTLDGASYNIYLGKKMADKLNSDYERTSIKMGSFPSEVDSVRNDPKKGNFLIKLIKKFYKKYYDDNGRLREDEVYEFDITEFFSKVKMQSKENKKLYVDRIEPYIAALKQAQDMGQQALYDRLEEQIFINKYESILYAHNFCYKITESQVVDFVKKAKKGVKLDYVKNFVRPIPKEVIDKKLEVDKLLVFDNYCIMHYDPDQKSWQQTEEEKRKERQEKADPILFGMINGSRDLYYITDWIDEYCDLTLEEFLSVSGLDKAEISLDEKIKF